MSNVFVDNDRKIIILQDKIDQESAYNINTSWINMEMNDNEKEENEKNFNINAIFTHLLNYQFLTKIKRVCILWYNCTS